MMNLQDVEDAYLTVSVNIKDLEDQFASHLRVLTHHRIEGSSKGNEVYLFTVSSLTKEDVNHLSNDGRLVPTKDFCKVLNNALF